MKKQKILHILGGLDHGGAEAFIMNALRFIDRSKYEFGIATFMQPKNGEKFDFEDELKAMGVKLYHVADNRFKNPLKFENDIAKIVKDNRYEAVHSHIDFMSALVLAGAKKCGAKKRIAHSHSVNNMKINSKKMQLVSAVLRRKLNRVATERIACGEDAGKFLYGPKQKFEVIHNGVDLERFRFNGNTRHKMRVKCGFSDDDMILLNIGRIEKVKNQGKLIDIFGDYSRKNKNSHLIIIGSGSEEEMLKEKIASERLEDNVTLIPAQDKVELYYMMADVFVMPSLFEGIPNVGVEAQACGMKCLFSDKVPREIKILDSTEFIPLNGDWVSSIKRAENRNAAVRQPGMKAFDIKETVKLLEAVYDK